MNTRILATSTLIAAGLSTLGLAQESTPSAPVPDEPPASVEEIDRQLAQAALRLARLNWKRAREVNESNPNTFGVVEMEMLRQMVAVAEQRLKLATGEVLLQDLIVQQAVAALKVAQAELRVVTELNEKMPGAVKPDEIDRAKLQVEVSRLQLARAQQSATYNSMLTQLQFQMDQMRSEMLQIQGRLNRALAR